MFAEGYAKARLYAKGRMKSGAMNKTEKAYSLYLESERQAGRIERFWLDRRRDVLANSRLCCSASERRARVSRRKGKHAHLDGRQQSQDESLRDGLPLQGFCRLSETEEKRRRLGVARSCAIFEVNR